MISRISRSFRRCLPRVSSVPVLLAAFGLAGAAPVSSADGQPAWGRLITSAAIAANPSTHKIYAVNEGASSVTVIDAANGSRRIVPVGSEPIALAVNRRTNRIYVANDGSGSVSVIDGGSDKVVATVPCDRLPYTLAVNEATNKVYVTHTYAGTVTVIDGATNTSSALRVGDADGIAIDSHTNTVFLMTYEDPNIRILDGATGALTKVAVGAHIWGVLFDEASGTLYLGHTGTAEVVALNERTHAISKLPVGRIPCALAINPVTRRLYAVNYGDRTLSVIDLNTKKVISTLPVGNHPQNVVVNPLSNRIYVANVLDDSVTVINGATNTVIGERDAGTHPYDIALDPASGRAFVADYAAPWVTPVTK
jgi:YVTN family beta-propeller protein